jgi:hypothetical protein
VRPRSGRRLGPRRPWRDAAPGPTRFRAWVGFRAGTVPAYRREGPAGRSVACLHRCLLGRSAGASRMGLGRAPPCSRDGGRGVRWLRPRFPLLQEGRKPGC